MTAPGLPIASWPTKPEKEIAFPLDDNELFNAAKFLSIVAYPRRENLVADGPAHACTQALIAHAFRRARQFRSIRRLPGWVGQIPTQQMNNRIRRAFKRLVYAHLAYMTFMDAELLKAEFEELADGLTPGMLIRQSADFSHIKITFAPHTEHLLPQLWRAAQSANNSRTSVNVRPGDTRANLRSSIFKHREAFPTGGRDEHEAYQHVHARYMMPMFRVLHLISELHERLLKLRVEELSLGRNPFEYLLMNPDWVGHAIKRATRNSYLAILRLRRMGVPSCHCRMVHFERISNLEFM